MLLKPSLLTHKILKVTFKTIIIILCHFVAFEHKRTESKSLTVFACWTIVVSILEKSMVGNKTIMIKVL